MFIPTASQERKNKNGKVMRKTEYNVCNVNVHERKYVWVEGTVSLEGLEEQGVD